MPKKCLLSLSLPCGTQALTNTYSAFLSHAVGCIDRIETLYVHTSCIALENQCIVLPDVVHEDVP